MSRIKSTKNNPNPANPLWSTAPAPLDADYEDKFDRNIAALILNSINEFIKESAGTSQSPVFPVWVDVFDLLIQKSFGSNKQAVALGNTEESINKMSANLRHLFYRTFGAQAFFTKDYPVQARLSATITIENENQTNEKMTFLFVGIGTYGIGDTRENKNVFLFEEEASFLDPSSGVNRPKPISQWLQIAGLEDKTKIKQLDVVVTENIPQSAAPTENGIIPLGFEDMTYLLIQDGKQYYAQEKYDDADTVSMVIQEPNVDSVRREVYQLRTGPIQNDLYDRFVQALNRQELSKIGFNDQTLFDSLQLFREKLFENIDPKPPRLQSIATYDDLPVADVSAEKSEPRGNQKPVGVLKVPADEDSDTESEGELTPRDTFGLRDAFDNQFENIYQEEFGSLYSQLQKNILQNYESRQKKQVEARLQSAKEETSKTFKKAVEDAVKAGIEDTENEFISQPVVDEVRERINLTVQLQRDDLKEKLEKIARRAIGKEDDEKEEPVPRGNQDDELRREAIQNVDQIIKEAISQTWEAPKFLSEEQKAQTNEGRFGRNIRNDDAILKAGQEAIQDLLGKDPDEENIKNQIRVAIATKAQEIQEQLQENVDRTAARRRQEREKQREKDKKIASRIKDFAEARKKFDLQSALNGTLAVESNKNKIPKVRFVNLVDGKSKTVTLGHLKFLSPKKNGSYYIFALGNQLASPFSISVTDQANASREGIFLGRQKYEVYLIVGPSITRMRVPKDKGEEQFVPTDGYSELGTESKRIALWVSKALSSDGIQVISHLLVGI